MVSTVWFRARGSTRDQPASPLLGNWNGRFFVERADALLVASFQRDFANFASRRLIGNEDGERRNSLTVSGSLPSRCHLVCSFLFIAALLRLFRSNNDNKSVVVSGCNFCNVHFPQPPISEFSIPHRSRCRSIVYRIFDPCPLGIFRKDASEREYFNNDIRGSRSRKGRVCTG